MRGILACTVALCATATAQAQMRITEYMYQGSASALTEFIEFTNIGPAPIDMTGWSFDDSSGTPGSQSLSAFGIVLPGESVILTELSTAAFNTRWSLVGVDVIGNLSNNLGRNDTINLYDDGNALVDTLSFGDEDFAGSIRTNGASGWVSAAGLGANNPFAYTKSTVGDFQGSVTSVGGDIGSPGRHIIPEPATLGLIALGGLLTARKRGRRS